MVAILSDKLIAKIKRSKKFTISLIISYFILIAIFFLSMASAYLITEENLENQLCENTFRSMDSILSEIENKIYSFQSINNSSIISDIINSEQPTLSEYNIYKTSSGLN